MEKIETIYCRVNAELKRSLKLRAKDRGENESVIVRDALRAYFGRQERTNSSGPAAEVICAAALHDAAAPPPPPSQAAKPVDPVRYRATPTRRRKK